MDVMRQTETQDYYAEAYVRVRAASEAEAAAMIEAAFTMEEERAEPTEGVFLTVCGGPWSGVEPVDEDTCTCPPEMVARNDGSFKGGCSVHA